MPTVSMTVNGQAVSGEVEGRTLLVQFLREHLGLTGTHVGCDTGQCGACVVHVDGDSMKSCNMLALAADGLHVFTNQRDGSFKDIAVEIGLDDLRGDVVTQPGQDKSPDERYAGWVGDTRLQPVQCGDGATELGLRGSPSDRDPLSALENPVQTWPQRQGRRLNRVVVLCQSQQRLGLGLRSLG